MYWTSLLYKEVIKTSFQHGHFYSQFSVVSCFETLQVELFAQYPVKITVQMLKLASDHIVLNVQ